MGLNDLLAGYSDKGGKRPATPPPAPTPAPPSPPSSTPPAVDGQQVVTDDDGEQYTVYEDERPEPPPAFKERPQYAPQFGNVDIADEDDDVDDPFLTDGDDDDLDIESTPTAAPAPAPTHDEAVKPGWMDDWNKPARGDNNAAGAEALHGNTPGFDDDDDDGVIRASGRKSGFLTGLLENPKEFFDQHESWKRPAIFGGVALVVALVIVFAFGGNPGSDSPSAPPPPVAQETPESDQEAHVGPLMPKAVSSSCPAGSTRAQLAFSSRKEEAWRCFRAHGMNGQIINMIFASNVCVKSVTIMPGWNYVEPNGTDHWNESKLVARILWRAGGKQFIQEINPTRAGSTYTFPGKCVVTKEMSLTIQSTVLPSSVAQDESVNGNGDGVLPPPLTGGDAAPTANEAEVEKWVAIGSISITGSEL
jgi:hypothetical protein